MRRHGRTSHRSAHLLRRRRRGASGVGPLRAGATRVCSASPDRSPTGNEDSSDQHDIKGEHMPSTTKLMVKALTGAIGAEISGVDLRREFDSATVAAIRQALLDHLVVFF